MKTRLGFTLALACVMLFVSAPSSQAQSQPWPGFAGCDGQMSAAITGDASFDVSGTPAINNYVANSVIRNPLFNHWHTCTGHPDECAGLPGSLYQQCVMDNQLCFGYRVDGTSCANNFTDPECGARRILNTMVLMKKVPMNSSISWFDHVGNESPYLFFKSTCALNGHTDFFLRIFVYVPPLFNMPLIRRASIIAHEAAHADGMTLALHCDDSIIGSTSNCKCPNSDSSCDEHWNWGSPSSNRRAVEFIEATLATGQEGVIALWLPPFVWYDAYQAANQILDGRFERHPGFNLVPEAGSDFVYGARKYWSFVSGYQVETSISGRELVDGATAVIQGISLTTTSNRTDDLRVCATMRKYEAELATYGSDTFARDISGITVIPGQTDPEDFGNPGCARRVLFSSPGQTMAKVVPPVQTVPRQMGIVGLRARTNGAGDMLEMQADYREIDRGAAVGAITTVRSNPGAPHATSWDVSQSSPIRGGFLTGVGFGAQNGVLSALAANWSLGPDLETRAGGLKD